MTLITPDIHDDGSADLMQCFARYGAQKRLGVESVLRVEWTPIKYKSTITLKGAK